MVATILVLLHEVGCGCTQPIGPLPNTDRQHQPSLSMLPGSPCRQAATVVCQGGQVNLKVGLRLGCAAAAPARQAPARQRRRCCRCALLLLPTVLPARRACHMKYKGLHTLALHNRANMCARVEQERCGRRRRRRPRQGPGAHLGEPGAGLAWCPAAARVAQDDRLLAGAPEGALGRAASACIVPDALGWLEAAVTQPDLGFAAPSARV